jgi:hypothetical protein
MASSYTLNEVAYMPQPSSITSWLPDHWAVQSYTLSGKSDYTSTSIDSVTESWDNLQTGSNYFEYGGETTSRSELETSATVTQSEQLGSDGALHNNRSSFSSRGVLSVKAHPNHLNQPGKAQPQSGGEKENSSKADAEHLAAEPGQKQKLLRPQEA